MSSWLKLINDLKRRTPEEYLTGSQRITYKTLYEMTRFPQWVNLYGVPGSGKTFIAWTMIRTTGATYISIPEQLRSLTSDQEILIIDNAPHIEEDVRRILAGCNLVNATMVILITRIPVTMPIRRVELPLPTHKEINEITRSLGRFGYLCEQTSLPASPNLWDVLQACI